MTSKATHVILLFLCLGIFGCDHATKAVAEDQLRDAKPVELVAGKVDFQYSQNYGVAFNIERVLPKAVQTPLIFIGGFMALFFIGVAWIRRYQTPSLEHVAFAMIAGGALGNLLDRLLRGYVVDFIHVHGWPIFNVADIAICMGVGLLLVHTYRSRDSESSAVPCP